MGDHVGPRSSLKSAAIIKVCCWLPGISHHVGADACAKRLSLLRALSELPKGTSEREVQMYLEHVCPREHEQARRAICGLLAYQQRADVGAAPLAVLGLQRYALESQLYMSPETFLSLHIFADERHPSAHGGRGKDGLSLWSIFNKTKTRFGEKLLRGWFARPTQDLDTLRERHDAIEFLTAAPNAQLHAQPHAEQHLQQQAGDAADHHGDDVAIDPPGDRVGREQGIGAAQDGAFAFRGIVEQVGDPAADGDLGRLQDHAASRHAFSASSARMLISRFLARPRSLRGILTPASSTLGASSGGRRP